MITLNMIKRVTLTYLVLILTISSLSLVLLGCDNPVKPHDIEPPINLDLDSNIIIFDQMFSTEAGETMLIINSTQFMQDVNIYENLPDFSNPTSAEFQLRANISQTYRGEAIIIINLSEIPAGKVIDSAVLYYFGSESLDANEEINIDAHHVYYGYDVSNYSNITWNNQPNSSQYNNTYESRRFFNWTESFLNVWATWTVTNMTQQAYSNGDPYLILWFRTVWVQGSMSPTGDNVNLYTIDTGTASIRPYLNITYSDSGGSTSSCPCPSTATDWVINMTENCNLTTSCDIGTGNITFIGTGTFNCNSNLNCSNILNIGSDNVINMKQNCSIILG